MGRPGGQMFASGALKLVDDIRRRNLTISLLALLNYSSSTSGCELRCPHTCSLAVCCTCRCPGAAFRGRGTEKTITSIYSKQKQKFFINVASDENFGDVSICHCLWLHTCIYFWYAKWPELKILVNIQIKGA